MCLNPRWIYKKGRYKENNYRGQANELYELGTMAKCGSCSQCIAEKCNNWVIRNYYEEKKHDKKCFITLTYRENPIIIVRKDIQDFMKRLRINLQRQGYKQKIRIFYSLEYGELNNRPHAHIIIYGWQDENAKYLGSNKKSNIYYHSDLIHKTWGLGRTSYQPFSTREAPYVALYNTAQETFKKAYKMTRVKLRQIEQYAMYNRNMPKRQRDNLYAEINELRKEFEDEKKKYIAIREKQGWSIALGWDEFEKQYNKQRIYAWTEYIEDKQFITPTPWVKKLANMGDYQAALEMFRREEQADKETNEIALKHKNEINALKKAKKELIEWNDKKNKIVRI